MSVKGYDTNVQLTQTKINVLKADTNWHSLNEKIFVGRYITSVNPNEKRLAPGEVELISANGYRYSFLVSKISEQYGLLY